MTLLVSADFDGQADGTAATTGTTGATGSFGSGVITHSTTRSITGASSLRVNGSSSNFLSWTGSDRNASYMSFYFWLPSDPAANSFIAQYTDAAAAVVAQVGFTTAGELRIRNGLSTVATTSGLQNNQWYRIDWTVNNTANSQRARLYTGGTLHSSDTADAWWDSGAQSYTGGDQRTSSVGAINGVAGGWQIFVDRFRVDDASMPTPFVSSAATPMTIMRNVGGSPVEYVIERNVGGVATPCFIERLV